MTFFHHVLLFINNNGRQLLRKWPSLPLLFLFPICIVGLAAYALVTFFIPEDIEAIKVGLIDQDKSKETTMIVELIEESSQLNNFIQLDVMSLDSAKQSIETNKLSAYITFPEEFTSDLYSGNPVTLEIVGNPNKQTDSYLIKELIDSVSRHIKTAQANILTMNYYAKQLDMTDEERNDFLYQQFIEFVYYTMGKERIIDEEILTNNVSTSPVHYYGLGGLFIIMTLWLILFYSILSKEENYQMKQRMKLFGVTEIQQLIAKIAVCWTATTCFSLLVFYGYFTLLNIELFLSDYVKIFAVTILYFLIFLVLLSLIEVIITSAKFRLLIQSVYTATLLLLSGAIVPTIYYPLYMQDIIPFNFTFQGFYALENIILNGRIYVDYLPLLIYLLVSIAALLGLSIWKERYIE
ncbi:ABC transporter permease [Virgibacillus flavescens]|uniref:ABC transporter permease n=1 Tax=Virgibacillus flavescens TaxID=1611422 RepID=UPI003D357E39